MHLDILNKATARLYDCKVAGRKWTGPLRPSQSVQAIEGRRMPKPPSNQISGEKSETRVPTAQTAGLTYAGIGFVFGVIVGVGTFITAWIYCVMAYGFVLGLGLGWFPSAICAGIVGWATVFLWGPVLVILLGFAGFVLVFAIGIKSSLVAHLALGAGVGWLVWRFSPSWLSGK